MNPGDTVAVLASSGSGQGYLELGLTVVAAVVLVVCLVVGVVSSRRGTGRPGVWFAVAVAAFVVGALSLTLV